MTEVIFADDLARRLQISEAAVFDLARQARVFQSAA
jgi:hypothetical protein